MKDRFKGLGVWALPLSWIYGLGVSCHRAIYMMGILPQYRAAKPVVSIGNITVGGVGKTPMTVWVAKQYLAKGLQVAIVLRGYKSVDGVSDEAQLLRELLPNVQVLVGANRRQSIEQALSNNPVDVFICDDAFQHWPLKRDLDIVLIDSTYPFGNRMLLPAGILREPISALKRVKVLVITKSDDDKPAQALVERLKTINQIVIVRARHRLDGVRDIITRQSIECKPQEKVLAVSSIADPSSFARTLAVMGFHVVNHVVFSDHEPYTAVMVNHIVDQAKQLGVTTIVTTHKDAVKIVPFQSLFSQVRIVCVDIQMNILDGEQALVDQLMAVIHA